MAESKIKSHIRRNKDGKTSRVKEGRRKSLGKKIAIVGATGVGLVGLGLAGRKLTKEVIRQKNIRDFNPRQDSAKVVTPIVADNPTPRARSIGTRVKLKNRKPRRVTTLKNTQEWADVLIAKKGLPPGIKVEHQNFRNNKRLPKKYQYQSSDASSVYTHGTKKRNLKSIKESGVINPATKRTLYGSKVYLEKLPALRNNYGDAVFEFPEAKLKPRGLELADKDLKIYTVPEALPISEASKLLVKNSYERRKRGGGRVYKNVKIRYKKKLNKLINFIKTNGRI